MDPRILARLCGALGGAAWAVRWVLAGQGAGDPVLGATYGAGLALLAIGLAGAGAELAGTAWLRVVVGLCLPLLAWSVLMAVRAGGEDVVVDGVAGVLAALVWVPLLRRTRRGRTGAHAV